MNKYKVTFYIRHEIFSAIEVWAIDEDWLDEFIRKFYPDTGWDYELIEIK